MTTGPEQRVGGGRWGNAPLSDSFDVLVRSVDSLNGQLRELNLNMQRSLEAQGRFEPGQGGSSYRQAAERVATDGQVRAQDLRGSAQRYSPEAGGTTPWSLAAGRQLAWDALNRAVRGGGPQQQQQGAPAGQTTTGGQAPTTFYQGPGGEYDLQGGQTQMGGPSQPGGGPGGGGGGGAGGGGQPPGGGGRGGPGGGMGAAPGGAHPGGGGWTNSVIGSAKKIPGVGQLIGGVEQVGNLYLSEREKNRRYQSMVGGSNWDAFGDRASEEVYRWSMGFGMSGSMARKSFQGVTALGYNGRTTGNAQNRQQALDFVYHNYNNRGMDINESLGFLQTASHDATVSFQSLSTALKDVSDTAGKAGDNAIAMRKSFEGMLATAISTGAGPGSAKIAGIMSSTQASYGREFMGSDFSGQLSTQYQYQIGAQYGLAPGQVQGLIRNNPQEYSRMVTGSQGSWINTVFSPDQVNELKRLISQYGTTQAAVDTISKQFLDRHPEIDINVLAQTLSGPLTGVQLDPSNVMKWVVQQLAGNTPAAHAGQQKTHAPVSASGTTKAGGYQGGNVQTGKSGLLVAPKDSSFTGNRAVEDELSRIHGGSAWWSLGAVKNDNKAGKTYVDEMKKSGKRDPVLEALLQNVQDPNSVQVKVSTSSGERVMSFADAMKYFPNELASGNVQFVSGKEKGKTTADVVGSENVDPTRDISKELTNAAGAKAGSKADDYFKKHPADKGGSTPSQRVTIDLSTEAKKLLTVLPSTNNESSATGYPPYNPYPTQASRP